MAADLSVKVVVDSSEASQKAKQLGQDFTQMGQSGDQASTKVTESTKKMSAQVREATVAAAAEKGAVEQLGHSMQATR